MANIPRLRWPDPPRVLGGDPGLFSAPKLVPDEVLRGGFDLGLRGSTGRRGRVPEGRLHHSCRPGRSGLAYDDIQIWRRPSRHCHVGHFTK